MRVPPFHHYVRWMRGTGLFLCGMVVGAAIYMSMHHQLYTLLAIKNEKLQGELKELRERLNTANSNKLRSSSIGSFDVRFEQSPDPDKAIDALTVEEIRAKVRANLRPLSGKSATILREAPLAFYALAEEPSYKTASGKKYKVTVKMFIFLQSELTVTVTAKLDTQP